MSRKKVSLIYNDFKTFQCYYFLLLIITYNYIDCNRGKKLVIGLIAAKSIKGDAVREYYDEKKQNPYNIKGRNHHICRKQFHLSVSNDYYYNDQRHKLVYDCLGDILDQMNLFSKAIFKHHEFVDPVLLYSSPNGVNQQLHMDFELMDEAACRSMNFYDEGMAHSILLALDDDTKINMENLVTRDVEVISLSKGDVIVFQATNYHSGYGPYAKANYRIHAHLISSEAKKLFEKTDKIVFKLCI